jgi:hypothetical protein
MTRCLPRKRHAYFLILVNNANTTRIFPCHRYSLNTVDPWNPSATIRNKCFFAGDVTWSTEFWINSSAISGLIGCTVRQMATYATRLGTALLPPRACCWIGSESGTNLLPPSQELTRLLTYRLCFILLVGKMLKTLNVTCRLSRLSLEECSYKELWCSADSRSVFMLPLPTRCQVN